MSGFELTVSVPADPRFAETLAALAVQAAQQGGCDAGVASEFGAAVGDALQGCIRACQQEGRPAVSVLLRRLASEIEAVLTLGVDPPLEGAPYDNRVRVARPAPIDV